MSERITYLGTGIGTLDGAKRYLRRKFNEGLPAPVQRRPGARFYVCARSGRRTVLLFGPYVSHMTALAQVPAARRLTKGFAFAAIGTCSAPVALPTRFGRGAR